MVTSNERRLYRAMKRDAAAAIKEYARVHQHAYRELPTSFSPWVVHKDLVLWFL